MDQESKNLELNKAFFKDFAGVMVPGSEIINHRFPTEQDKGAKYFFELSLGQGYLEFNVHGKYEVGDEVSVMYKNGASNAYMIHTYG